MHLEAHKHQFAKYMKNKHADFPVSALAAESEEIKSEGEFE